MGKWVFGAFAVTGLLWWYWGRRKTKNLVIDANVLSPTFGLPIEVPLTDSQGDAGDGSVGAL